MHERLSWKLACLFKIPLISQVVVVPNHAEQHSKSHNHLHTASMLCSSLDSPSIKTCCKLHLMPHFRAEPCVSLSPRISRSVDNMDPAATLGWLLHLLHDGEEGDSVFVLKESYPVMHHISIKMQNTLSNINSLRGKYLINMP